MRRTVSDDIVDALRSGDGIWRDKRWTGDTFHDIGPIDEVALDALLEAAADEIERLRNLVRDDG